MISGVLSHPDIQDAVIAMRLSVICEDLNTNHYLYSPPDPLHDEASVLEEIAARLRARGERLERLFRAHNTVLQNRAGLVLGCVAMATVAASAVSLLWAKI